MPTRSAGILMYRRQPRLEVLLVHPGGPFWKNKDIGAWSIPKGEYTNDEDPLTAAQREFEEETGIAISGKFIELSAVKLKSGKLVSAWAINKNIDTSNIKSNTISFKQKIIYEKTFDPRSGIPAHRWSSGSADNSESNNTKP